MRGLVPLIKTEESQVYEIWMYMHAATLPLPKTAAADFHLVLSERATNILRTQGWPARAQAGSKLGFQRLIDLH